MKHDWNTLDDYLSVHHRILHFYGKYMETPKAAYQVTQLTPRFYTLECAGIIFRTYLSNRVRVDIYKEILVDDSNPRRRRARTIGYSYNANTPQGANLIRYDSPDPLSTLGTNSPHHHSYHHKHDESVSPSRIIRIEDDEYPHVGEFFDEILSRF
ncbi:hypothetical protein WDW86_03595 [Bdellovibrionota bacterium FG-2]